MEVTIERCGNKNYWYNSRIGESFEVELHNDIRRYKVKDSELTIDIEDTISWDDYNSGEMLDDHERVPSKNVYEELRLYLQNNDAPAHLKQKLFVLFQRSNEWYDWFENL